MNDIAIYGAGGLGRETALMLEQLNAELHQWNVVGFFDDAVAAGISIGNLPVLGNREVLNNYKTPLAVAIAIADSSVRRDLVQYLTSSTITYPTLIHPMANIGSKTNVLGEGNIITANCILTTGVTIANFVIVNLACTIGHDTVLNDYCSIMPGTHISGNCTIGEGSLIGTGAKMLQNLSVGKYCKVGAGAVVINNVDDGMTVVGVPARSV